MTNISDPQAVARLGERRKNQPEQIDNNTLRAGSPMYFYCSLCGHLADKLPESYWASGPKSHCDECSNLKEATGLTDETLIELADKETSNPDVEKLKALEDMCIDIFAHSENDYEVCLAGNGVNCSEAGLMALAVSDILHGDGRAWRKENEERIAEAAKGLRKLYGAE